MLHVCVLGEQSVTDERTARVRIRSSRTVALIGFLAAHPGSPQTRQRIAGLFWPESADGQALTNLRREKAGDPLPRLRRNRMGGQEPDERDRARRADPHACGPFIGD